MVTLAVQLLLLLEAALGIAVQQRPLEPTPQESTAYFWAGKNGDASRTGTSIFPAPRELGDRPSWSFHEDVKQVFFDLIPGLSKTYPAFTGLTRAAPLIDHRLNIYLSTVTMGIVYKFSPEGQLLWKYKHGPAIQLPGIPAIMEGRLFTATAKGEVLALDMETGQLLWSTKIADSIGGDTWSMAASDGMIIAPAARGAATENTRLVAVRARDGSQVWAYDSDVIIYNVLVSIRGGSCVFSTFLGDVHRLDLQTGDQIWASPRPQRPEPTTGGSVIGPDGVVYATWNEQRPDGAGREGWVGAFNFSDGSSLWRTKVGYEANNAPAVGKLGQDPNAGLSVVLGIGANPKMPDTKKGILSGEGPELKARVVALDAVTGKPRWGYELPAWHGAALGDDHRPDICLPDAFSNPAIGGDGTVYIGFQSGLLYSIRDDNFDAYISGSEVSTFQTGAAFQGSPAIAPGMLVATPCDGMYVWRWRLNGRLV